MTIGWSSADLVPAFDAMIAHRLAFDALIKPHHLPPRLIHVVERHPQLRVVIDHASPAPPHRRRR